MAKHIEKSGAHFTFHAIECSFKFIFLNTHSAYFRETDYLTFEKKNILKYLTYCLTSLSKKWEIRDFTILQTEVGHQVFILIICVSNFSYLFCDILPQYNTKKVIKLVIKM